MLIKFASSSYNPCKQKKTEVIKKFHAQEEKDSVIVKKFDDSIIQLKKIELHEALKNEKQKCLLDIYYNVEAMQKWKKSCLDHQLNLKGKIEKMGQNVKAIKEKIKEERDQCGSSTHPAFMAQKQTFDNCKKEIEPLALKVFEEHYKVYRNLRDALENYASTKSSDAEVVIRDDSFSKYAERDLDEDRKIYSENLERIEKIIDQVNKMKSTFENQVSQCYKVMLKYTNELNLLCDKYVKFSEEIDKMDRDFNYLLNPSLLPAAYNASLAEVSRKREFLANFDKAVKKI
jgi:hypothetical protein